MHLILYSSERCAQCEQTFLYVIICLFTVSTGRKDVLYETTFTFPQCYICVIRMKCQKIDSLQITEVKFHDFNSFNSFFFLNY